MRHDSKTSRLYAIVLLACTASAACADEPGSKAALDPATGMKIAPGWEIVRNNCIACHSAQQFLRQRGNATTWTEMIRWMQREGGLWPLSAETETAIVSYLADNYGPTGAYRRAPIPATLMPKNPYVSEARRTLEKAKRQQADDSKQP